MDADEEWNLPNIDTIKTRKDLVDFLDKLAQHSGSEWWENGDLRSYLRGAAGFVHDVDGAYLNQGETFDEKQNYRLIAMIFLAATSYE